MLLLCSGFVCMRVDYRVLCVCVFEFVCVSLFCVMVWFALFFVCFVCVCLLLFVCVFVFGLFCALCSCFGMCLCVFVFVVCVVLCCVV